MLRSFSFLLFDHFLTGGVRSRWLSVVVVVVVVTPIISFKDEDIGKGSPKRTQEEIAANWGPTVYAS